MSEKPVRVQLSRAKGWRMPDNTVKVDRTTRWGNPFNWKDIPRYAQDADDDVGDRRSDALLRSWSVTDFESAIKHEAMPWHIDMGPDHVRAMKGSDVAAAIRGEANVS